MLLQLQRDLKTHPVATDYRSWMDLILHKIIASDNKKQNYVSACASKNWYGNSQLWEKRNINYLEQLRCNDYNWSCSISFFTVLELSQLNKNLEIDIKKNINTKKQ